MKFWSYLISFIFEELFDEFFEYVKIRKYVDKWKYYNKKIWGGGYLLNLFINLSIEKIVDCILLL